jgi:hypothetical protein
LPLRDAAERELSEMLAVRFATEDEAIARLIAACQTEPSAV